MEKSRAKYPSEVLYRLRYGDLIGFTTLLASEVLFPATVVRLPIAYSCDPPAIS